MAKVHPGADGKDQPRLMERLGEKSHEELLALLKHLVQRQPEIEPLIELLVELPRVPTVPGYAVDEVSSV